MFLLTFNQLSIMEIGIKNFEIKFGNNLKKLRLSKNLSQEMLANDANIPINQIGRIDELFNFSIRRICIHHHNWKNEC